MKIIQILSERVNKVEGTNCDNCIWKTDAETRKVQKEELNDQGGLISTNTDDLRNAKTSDLVTLPGRASVDSAFYCKHAKVKQWVTSRMCCIFWDAPGVHRAFGKMSVK